MARLVGAVTVACALLAACGGDDASVGTAPERTTTSVLDPDSFAALGETFEFEGLEVVGTTHHNDFVDSIELTVEGREIEFADEMEGRLRAQGCTVLRQSPPSGPQLAFRCAEEEGSLDVPTDGSVATLTSHAIGLPDVFPTDLPVPAAAIVADVRSLAPELVVDLVLPPEPAGALDRFVQGLQGTPYVLSDRTEETIDERGLSGSYVTYAIGSPTWSGTLELLRLDGFAGISLRLTPT